MWKTKGKKQMKEYFKNFNGGQGLDHWSPSSSQNFTRFILNYSLPQELRRLFKVTKGKVSLQDLYESWWDYEENK